MTKRLAVFVEGLTEQDFTIQLLTALAGNHGISFEIQSQHKGLLSWVEYRSTITPVIHVLVANCCNHDQVKSQILDRYSMLKAAGYSLIIGLRDVYPFKHHEIIELKRNLLIGLPTDSPPVQLHLAIMEIEAWFIEEITHFSRIDDKITTAEVIANGFDSAIAPACNLPHPAKTLDDIYKSVGKRYKKNRRQIQRTINALSYEELYINTRQKAPSLDNFITSLEEGLFSTT